MKVILLWHGNILDGNGVVTGGCARQMSFARIDEAREYFKKTLIGVSRGEIVRDETGNKMYEFLEK